MNLSTAQVIEQKAVLVGFDTLNEKKRKPQLALHNGLLFIYKYERNSLYETILQIFSRIINSYHFYVTKTISFDATLIENCKTKIQLDFDEYLNNIIETRKGPLLQELKATQESLAQIKLAKSSLTEEYKGLEKRKKSTQIELTELQSSLRELNYQFNNAKETIEDAKKLNVDSNKVIEVEKKLQELNKNKIQLEDEIKTLDKDSKRSLEQEIIKLRKIIDSQSSEDNEELEELKKELKVFKGYIEYLAGLLSKNNIHFTR